MLRFEIVFMMMRELGREDKVTDVYAPKRERKGFV
jgi:hypothetical protein